MAEAVEHRFGSSSLTLYPPSGFQPVSYEPVGCPKLQRVSTFRPSPTACAVAGPNEIAFTTGNVVVIQNLETDVQRFFCGQSEVLCVAFSNEEEGNFGFPVHGKSSASALRSPGMAPGSKVSRPSSSKSSMDGASARIAAFGEKGVATAAAAKGGKPSTIGDIVLFNASADQKVTQPKRRLHFHKGDVVQLKFLSNRLLVSFSNDKGMTGALWAVSPGAQTSAPLRVFNASPSDLCRGIVLLPPAASQDRTSSGSGNAASKKGDKGVTDASSKNSATADPVHRFLSYGTSHLKFWEISRIAPQVVPKCKRASFLQGYSPKLVTSCNWFGDPAHPTVAAGTEKGEVFFFHDASSMSGVRVVPETTSKFGRTQVNAQHYCENSPIVALKTQQTSSSSLKEQKLLALSEHGSVLVFHVRVAKRASASAVCSMGGALDLRGTSSSRPPTAASSFAARNRPLAANKVGRPSTGVPSTAGASRPRSAVTSNAAAALLPGLLSPEELDRVCYVGGNIAVVAMQSINVWTKSGGGLRLDRVAPVFPILGAVHRQDSLTLWTKASIVQCNVGSMAATGTQNVLRLDQSTDNMTDGGGGSPYSTTTAGNDASAVSVLTQSLGTGYTCAASYGDLLFLGSLESGVSAFRKVADKLLFEISFLPYTKVTAIAAGEYGLAVAAGDRLVIYKDYAFTAPPIFDRVVLNSHDEAPGAMKRQHAITCLDFDHLAGAASLAFGTQDGAVYFVDLLQKPVRPKVLRGHASAVVCVAFVHPGKLLLTTSAKQVIAFDPAMMRRVSPQEVRECVMPSNVPNKMPYSYFTRGAWDPSKQYFANRKFLQNRKLLVASNGRRFSLHAYPCLEAGLNAVRPSIVAHSNGIADLCVFDEDGSFLTVSRESVALWSASQPQPIEFQDLSPAAEAQRRVCQDNAFMKYGGTFHPAQAFDEMNRSDVHDSAEASPAAYGGGYNRFDAHINQDEYDEDIQNSHSELETQMAQLKKQMDSLQNPRVQGSSRADSLGKIKAPGVAVVVPDAAEVGAGGISFQPASRGSGTTTVEVDPNVEGRRERLRKQAASKEQLSSKIGVDTCTTFTPFISDPSLAAGVVQVDRISADFKTKTKALRRGYQVEVTCRQPIVNVENLNPARALRFTAANTGDVAVVPVLQDFHAKPRLA
ncbi:unnamed protein product [Amoebophrya sp. A25]|nr:unnamed protein product [Amoebophrya sp. A25]|eukprot:GSA25T00014639001.1